MTYNNNCCKLGKPKFRCVCPDNSPLTIHNSQLFKLLLRSKRNYMFFIGAISSLFPWLATIALMCVYFFVGSPKNGNKSEASVGVNKTITLEQRQHFNDTKYAAEYSYSQSVADKKSDFSPHTVDDIKTTVVDYTNHYHSAETNSNLNKAPPIFS